MYENARKFQQLLAADENLRNEIQAAAKAYSGDTSDDRAVFEAVIAPVAQSAGIDLTYDEARAAALDGRELSEDELDLVAGGVGPLYRRLISGALVATMVFGSIPVMAVAEEFGMDDSVTISQQYLEDDDLELEDSSDEIDEEIVFEDDDEMPYDEEDIDIEFVNGDVEVEADALLEANFNQAMVSLAATGNSESRKSENKRAKILKGVEVTAKAMFTLGKLAAGIASMNPSLLLGGGGDAVGVILTLCGIGHGGPSNQDIMDGINDVKASLKDIKSDLTELKKSISDLSLKNDIQYASKLIDALLALESDCAGAENYYTPRMLAKIGMEPLPEDATSEQIVEWCEQVGKALNKAKKDKVSGFEYYNYYNKRIRSDLTTIYTMLKEGSESNPIDAWYRYWEGTCNFESQAYMPKAWLKTAIEAEVMRGYSLVAIYTNMPSDPEVIEISTTKDMQEMLSIAEDMDCGVSPEEAVAGERVMCYSLGRTARRHSGGIRYTDNGSFGASVTIDQVEDFMRRANGELSKDLERAGLFDGSNHGMYLGIRVTDVVDGSSFDGVHFIGWDAALSGLGQTYDGLGARVFFPGYSSLFGASAANSGAVFHTIELE